MNKHELPTTSEIKVLLAIPTNRYIEPETFQSIYNLEVPDGVTVDFKYFYGYQIDQIRNLIAAHACNYDYLFSVDSDIILPKDALVKMLAHNVHIVSGVYIQRKQGLEVPEIYRQKNGGTSNVQMADIMPPGLYEIDGCGFGCVLVNCNVFRHMTYPHFKYEMASATQIRVSEDNYFCAKAQRNGVKIYVDSSIICEHIGQWKFFPTIPQVNPAHHPKIVEVSQQDLLPQSHKDYLVHMRDNMNVNPKVIFDIGACVLHWTNSAKKVWDSEYIVFEAMDETKFLYEQENLRHFNDVLSDEDNKEVDFYQNLDWFGGNSYYRENPELNEFAATIFNESHIVKKKTRTLDSLVKEHALPQPELIKIDVQGAELDVLMGALETLKGCKDIIIELQHTEYNKGAPHASVVIGFLQQQGFQLISPFVMTAHDGDYHFRRK